MKTVMAMAAFVGILASGCSRETAIRGQVFVVRSDRETVRLSGAKVIVGRESEVTNKLAHLKEEVANLKQQSVSDLKSLEEQERTLNTKLTEVEGKLDEAQRGLRTVKLYIEERRRTIESNGWQMRFMDAVSRVEQAKVNQRWNAEMLKAQRETLPGWENYKAKQEAERESLNDQIAEITKKRERAKKQIEQGELAKRYFEADFQSNGFPSTLADADGRFELNLRLKERPMIVVRAQRNIAAATEYYFWAERVNSTNILLSNENMVEDWAEISPWFARLMSGLNSEQKSF